MNFEDSWISRMVNYIYGNENFVIATGSIETASGNQIFAYKFS